jgi:hypothetical protein
MTKRKIRTSLVVVALVAGLLAAPAEARNCKKLCKSAIRQNIAEVCSRFRGRAKRICKRDVKQTLIGFCKDQSSGDCFGL